MRTVDVLDRVYRIPIDIKVRRGGNLGDLLPQVYEEVGGVDKRDCDAALIYQL